MAPNIKVLKDKIHLLEKEINWRDRRYGDLQNYMMDLENKNRFMNDTISRLQQQVSDFQFEKLQLNNQIIERDNHIGMIMAMNPHIMMNMQNVSDIVYYDCPTYPNAETAQPEVAEGVSSFPQISNTSLMDIRDRYDDLLAEFPENNEEVNWTLTMITKIVDYYENQGKCVYEEKAANKFISTLILVDKNDPAPNKLEGTFAIGNGDTPLEATQCAVQWAYGYIQNLIAGDSNGDDLPKSATGSVITSPRRGNRRRNSNSEDGSGDGSPTNVNLDDLNSSLSHCSQASNDSFESAPPVVSGEENDDIKVAISSIDNSEAKLLRPLDEDEKTVVEVPLDALEPEDVNHAAMLSLTETLRNIGIEMPSSHVSESISSIVDQYQTQ